jgi:hypothetical protein
MPAYLLDLINKLSRQSMLLGPCPCDISFQIRMVRIQGQGAKDVSRLLRRSQLADVQSISLLDGQRPCGRGLVHLKV